MISISTGETVNICVQDRTDYLDRGFDKKPLV